MAKQNRNPFRIKTIQQRNKQYEENSLIFNEHKVYYFLPEDYWWKQLLINLAWVAFFLLIQWLLSCI